MIMGFTWRRLVGLFLFLTVLLIVDKFSWMLTSCWWGLSIPPPSLKRKQGQQKLVAQDKSTYNTTYCLVACGDFDLFPDLRAAQKELGKVSWTKIILNLEFIYLHPKIERKTIFFAKFLDFLTLFQPIEGETTS